jgi:hypothetical protein
MRETGKAAVMMAANKDLEIIEYPLPVVEKGCILVRVTCCTICGSDLHTWLGRRSGPVPCILGHDTRFRRSPIKSGGSDYLDHHGQLWKMLLLPGKGLNDEVSFLEKIRS